MVESAPSNDSAFLPAVLFLWLMLSTGREASVRNRARNTANKLCVCVCVCAFIERIYWFLFIFIYLLKMMEDWDWSSHNWILRHILIVTQSDFGALLITKSCMCVKKGEKVHFSDIQACRGSHQLRLNYLCVVKAEVLPPITAKLLRAVTT